MGGFNLLGALDRALWAVSATNAILIEWHQLTPAGHLSLMTAPGSPIHEAKFTYLAAKRHWRVWDILGRDTEILEQGVIDLPFRFLFFL